MKPEMLFLSGWAHAASALEPLAEAVQPWPECRFGSLHPSPRDSELPNDLQALVRYTHSLPVPPIGIGWSGGGIRALDAADHGALWSGLVLISSTARFCSDREDPCGTPHAQLRALRAALQSPRQRSALTAFHRACALPEPLEDAEAESRACGSERLGLDSLIAGLDYLKDTDLRKACSSVRIPTLILHGEEDRVIPPEASRILADLLPDARLRFYPAMGHRLPQSAPGLLAQEILSFWEALGHDR